MIPRNARTPRSKTGCWAAWPVTPDPGSWFEPAPDHEPPASDARVDNLLGAAPGYDAGDGPWESTVTDLESIVYVVDDDASIRAGVESLLRSAGLAVQCFASASEFIARPPHHVPACLILDVHLPEGSGLDLQPELAGRDELPIVFITGHGDIPMSVRAMKAGAIEFLPKPFRDKELLDAIEQALRKARADWHARLDLSGLRARFESLTPRERQVLAHVVNGMLNKQIASELGISEVTVKGHRGHVMKKLNASSLAELVRMAARVGVEHEPGSATGTSVA
jgi:FixJ family two-component response regulator